MQGRYWQVRIGFLYRQAMWRRQLSTGFDIISFSIGFFWQMLSVFSGGFSLLFIVNCCRVGFVKEGLVVLSSQQRVGGRLVFQGLWQQFLFILVSDLFYVLFKEGREEFIDRDLGFGQEVVWGGSGKDFLEGVRDGWRVWGRFRFRYFINII